MRLLSRNFPPAIPMGIELIIINYSFTWKKKHSHKKTSKPSTKRYPKPDYLFLNTTFCAPVCCLRTLSSPPLTAKRTVSASVHSNSDTVVHILWHVSFECLPNTFPALLFFKMGQKCASSNRSHNPAASLGTGPWETQDPNTKMQAIILKLLKAEKGK